MNLISMRSLIRNCLFSFFCIFTLVAWANTASATGTKHHPKHSTVKTSTKTTASAKTTASKTKVANKTSKKTHKVASKKINKSPALALPMNANMPDGINHILANFSRLNPGVLVQSADGNSILYQHDGNQGLMPGSTMKLFTASAALSFLGPNYIFPTRFLSNSNNIQNGVLNGNLYVKFTGDPQLTIDDLNSMVTALTKSGIDEIRGNLIIDGTDMDRSNTAQGWKPEEQYYCYSSPSIATIINRNCFGVTVTGTQNGSYARVSTTPPGANIRIINQVLTRNASCPLVLKIAGPNNTYTLTGCIKPHRTVSMGVAMSDPQSAGANIVANLLRQHDICLSGQIQYGRVPNNSYVLASHDSKPLSALVTRMLKKSDNLIANSLFKKLGNVYYKTTGTWQNSAAAERAILANSGVDFNQVAIFDGAGLSRNDYVTPEQFGRLLNYDLHYLPNRSIFYQALPISGVDGTLKNRMGGPTLAKIHAKTGTLDYMSGLAGYVQNVDHKTYIFAILINANTGNQGTYHLLQDKVCQFLALNHFNGSATALPTAGNPATTQ